MALVIADRVQETTTTTGTGTVTLAGAVTGYQSFSAIGNTNTTYYTITDPATGDWEVGIGTYTTSGTTLSRTTVLASSNAGSLVSFGAGNKFVFSTYPAGKAIYQDANGNIGLDATVNPSWDAGRSVLQIANNNSINTNTANGNYQLYANVYVDGVGAKYAATGFGAVISIAQTAGSITLGTYPSGTVGNSVTSAASVQLNQADFEMNTATGGIGYGVGSGGTVTQLTNRTTAVTLNKPTGAITMFTAAGSTTAASFTVNNSIVAIEDTIVLSQRSGTNLYDLMVTAVAAGSFRITFRTTGGTASDAPVINFTIIRGAVA